LNTASEQGPACGAEHVQCRVSHGLRRHKKFPKQFEHRAKRSNSNRREQRHTKHDHKFPTHCHITAAVVPHHLLRSYAFHLPPHASLSRDHLQPSLAARQNRKGVVQLAARKHRESSRRFISARQTGAREP